MGKVGDGVKSVLVLMATYNGEKYLREQIESILCQKDVNITLRVRDDGSTDGTLDILNEYKEKGLLTWYTGANIKPAKSFMDLIFTSDINYDYYALSDQDDVWLENKLKIAIEKLSDNVNKPSLYFSLQTYVDENLNKLDTQVKFGEHDYSFAQVFVKNMAAGCTMVMDRALIKILKKYKPKEISMHDRWIYLVCRGVGGNIYYDRNSYILYRQHSANVTGKKSKLELAKIRISRLLGKNQFAYKHALELKNGFYNILSKSNQEIVDEIILYNVSWSNKWTLLSDKRFRVHDNNLSNLSFIIKILLNNV